MNAPLSSPVVAPPLERRRFVLAPIVVRAGRAGDETDLAHGARFDLDRVGSRATRRLEAQAMQRRACCRGRVSHERVDLGSLRNSNEWTWNAGAAFHLRRTRARRAPVGVAIGMPLAGVDAETHREHALGEHAGRRPIVVDDDAFDWAQWPGVGASVAAQGTGRESGGNGGEQDTHGMPFVGALAA